MKCLQLISNVLFLDIEDLTHKTGNFKQFKVFLNMLASALNKVRKFSNLREVICYGLNVINKSTIKFST